MHYYRTKKDIKNLVSEFQSEFKHRSQIRDFIIRKHKMPELGLFTSMTKDTVWLGKGNIGRKDNQFRLTEDIIDYFVRSGIFDDAINGGSLVSIMGQLEKGKLIDIVALNLENLIDPDVP